jgi:GTP-binding protein Era
MQTGSTQEGTTADPFRSGFVCLVGRPNVGKSTLLNRLVGRPVSITAPKPQTTRNRILGIRHGDGYQAVFVDTPGIHAARDTLNQRMVNYALGALADADVVLMLVEVLRGGRKTIPKADQTVLEHVRQVKTPCLLAVNKIDAASEAEVLQSLATYGAVGRFDELVPLSAQTGRGVERLEALIPRYLQEGPPYFDPDWVTDQSEPVFMAELIRQELFRRTQEEVPYSTAVKVEHLEEQAGRLTVYARIYVERDTQKGIVIGKGGSMLKSIGRAARLSMERLLGVKVFLDLQVSVLKDWSHDPRHLAELGYPES